MRIKKITVFRSMNGKFWSFRVGAYLGAASTREAAFEAAEDLGLTLMGIWG